MGNADLWLMEKSDFDGDGDVDESDFEIFEEVWIEGGAGGVIAENPLANIATLRWATRDEGEGAYPIDVTVTNTHSGESDMRTVTIYVQGGDGGKRDIEETAPPEGGTSELPEPLTRRAASEISCFAMAES